MNKILLLLVIITIITIIASCTRNNQQYSSSMAIPLVVKVTKYGKKIYDNSVRRKTVQQAKEALEKRSKQPPKSRRFYEKKKSFRMKTAQEARNSLDKRSKSFRYDKKINSSPPVTNSPKKNAYHVSVTGGSVSILAVIGTVGFTSFVLEEAEQSCMFGNFGLSKPHKFSDNPERDEFARMSVAAVMACFKIHDVAETFNNTIGYINPFGFSYRSYQDANEIYLCSQIWQSLKYLKREYNTIDGLEIRCKPLFIG